MTKDTLSASLGNLEANYPSSTPTPTISTPPSGESSPRPRSRKSSPYRPAVSFSTKKAGVSPAPKDWRGEDNSDDQELDEEDEAMGDKEIRPHYHRPNDGRSSAPLLKDEGGRTSYDSPNGSARPPLMARKSTFRSRSPDVEGSKATKKKYTYAAFFLGVSLISFVIQTETAVYIQDELKWKKAYCMLYVTFLPLMTEFRYLTYRVSQGILPTAPGPYYGRLNSSSCDCRIGGPHGNLSGANTSTLSGLQRKWWNHKIFT